LVEALPAMEEDFQALYATIGQLVEKGVESR
jgi:hypothetical protein